MIVVLAQRFRKHIALFLYIVFYSDLLMGAAGHLRYYNSVTRGTIILDLPLSGRRMEQPAAAESQTVGTESYITTAAAPFIGGPSQPEMQSFSPVNANNMVDLFSGDFSYNIPLLDVGGYPVNISYHSGRSMDEDASWVGLGWNINPGSITRDMRGLPDDFNGGDDTLKKWPPSNPISTGV
ncbi:hypothetical protein ACQ86N_41235 [Puia sp. P3]|uniref:hypothetical protein n=1 Tax=Puia sp. P3 TaxID=3423952 RepID=UPI003D6716E8